MNRAPHRRALLASIALLGSTLLAPALAEAGVAAVSKRPLVRAGQVVGQASGFITYATNGFAVSDARVSGFVAPVADASWRARTVLRAGCIRMGWTPEAGSAEDFGYAEFTRVSRWRSTRVTGRSGAISTNDIVHECPAGQEPFGPTTVSLVVQRAGTGAAAGASRLWAAG